MVKITTGETYYYSINVYVPIFCQCSTFLDMAYCQHMLTINALNLAYTIIDLTFIASPAPRRLGCKIN